MHSLGRRKAVATGLSFISAIFLGYYALGLGIFQALVVVPQVEKTLAILGLMLGSVNILRGVRVRVKFKSPISKSFRKFMELRIGKSYASIIASFLLGLIATFTLLPCTGGPYIVGLGLLSALKDAVQVYLLLALYNLIFVTPLILIMAALAAFSSTVRKIKALRSRNLRAMGLISGLLLAMVCIYLLVL